MIIDYLQLMELSGKTGNRVSDISEATRALKILARELEVPVMLLVVRWVNRSKVRSFAQANITKFGVKGRWNQNAGQMSGGNQQKVVIAKWLATRPKVIILDEPTKGIDIGSKAAVHAFMSELAASGLSVIMVSSEIPEIMGMADRVIVMREGRMAGLFERQGLTPEALVRAATGNKEAAA